MTFLVPAAEVKQSESPGISDEGVGRASIKLVVSRRHHRSSFGPNTLITIRYFLGSFIALSVVDLVLLYVSAAVYMSLIFFG